MPRGRGGWEQSAPEKQGSFVALLSHPLVSGPALRHGPILYFQRPLKCNVLLLVYYVCKDLADKYVCNCTVVTTASQRQHIIKLTLVVIELSVPDKIADHAKEGVSPCVSHTRACVALPPRPGPQGTSVHLRARPHIRTGDFP